MSGRNFRPKYTLRGMLVVVVLLSCVLSWLAVKREQARRQHVVVKHAGERGLLAYGRYPWNNEPSLFAAADDPLSRTPRNAFGVHLFRQVCWLYSVGIFADRRYRVPFDDDDMQLLRELADLSVLQLDGTRVADQGLAYLRGLHNLESLSLSRTGVTDAGLRHLKDLPKLRHLSLRETNVTDAGVAIISGITGLESLDLRGTKITDHALASLNNLRRLKRLNLSHTGLTDDAGAKLQQMRNLQELHLGGTRMSTESRQAIVKSLPKLFPVKYVFCEPLFP